MTEEKWLPAYGYESRYEVSDRGQVRVIGRDQMGRKRYMGHILSPNLVKGYSHYILHKGDGTAKNVLAHVLVAETFIGPRPEGLQVNHKNGNKSDPQLENLEYVTRSQNHRHALETGLFVPPSGISHWSASLDDKTILEIRSRSHQGETNASLAKQYGCSTATISRYKNGVGRAALVS